MVGGTKGEGVVTLGEEADVPVPSKKENKMEVREEGREMWLPASVELTRGGGGGRGARGLVLRGANEFKL
jgi:hypothetical protein